MTLSQWVEQTGIKPTAPMSKYSAVSVVISHRHLWRNVLWKLDDFRVSTAGGNVIWLVPRKQT